LKEDRTRSHANNVRRFLHHGRQPKKLFFAYENLLRKRCSLPLTKLARPAQGLVARALIMHCSPTDL
ncbi:hypothetical protein ACROSR_15995, partial [Roseovarius tibetensis]|uniref:hypothetical protein n=1 Tax=Roseovarius tibetensis TaxID=2685897 RepID=UPI003D7F284F